MSSSTHFHRQVLDYLRQYSHHCDLRHLKAPQLDGQRPICSGQLSLPAWEPYVPSRAQKRKVSSGVGDGFSTIRVDVCAIYLPLVLAALSGWQSHRLYLARHHRVVESLLYDSSIGGLLWASRAIGASEHGSATVAFKEYQPLLRKARCLRHHHDVMLLADRGFANHDLMSWLQTSGWHYCLRLPSDVLLHGPDAIPLQ